MNINKEYKEMAKDILESEYFQELKKDTHHGSTRYDHCKRVGRVSLVLAKIFRGNKEEVVKAGLLHDFFYGKTGSKEAINYLNHPQMSVKNAQKYFEIDENVADDIKTHMFHYALVKKCFPFIKGDKCTSLKDQKPKSKEGVIVCLADLLVSIFEVGVFKVRYDMCLYMLFFMNIIRF